nr:MAG TPA: hypothetical protein [Caudoviricetes sp.]
MRFKRVVSESSSLHVLSDYKLAYIFHFIIIIKYYSFIE